MQLIVVCVCVCVYVFVYVFVCVFMCEQAVPSFSVLFCAGDSVVTFAAPSLRAEFACVRIRLV